ncbi:MAG: hypothetical protein J6V25_08365 [Oscillospiraceae bacterium]|nr:hypothetical protein [Oscillospiraceae bacterium]
MKKMKRMLALLAIFTMLLGAAPQAAAADGNVTYLGTASTFIFRPGSGYSLTDLFPNFKDVMPGDSITQNIYVKNITSNRVKVRIYMRALGAHADSVEFLSQMHLTVEKVEDTIMFDAAADQKAQLSEWTYLGTLYSGGEVELKVTLDVPVTMGNEFQKAVGYLDWQFMVEELPIEDSDPKPPKTGDDIMGAVFVMLTTGTALTILLPLAKKKKKKD